MFQREPLLEDETERDRFIRVMGKIGPTLLLASFSESACFFIGAISNIPAIRIFALNAGFALLINFILQISAFACLLYLDNLRQESKNFDVCCCFGLSKYYSTDEDQAVAQPGLIHRFFTNILAPTLMKDITRLIVMLFFSAWLCFSVSTLHKVEIGLDQKLSMPADSYVMRYFEGQTELRVGPPVYFVIGGYYRYGEQLHQNMICGVSHCSQDSLVNLISKASYSPNVTYIAKAASSWLDDYNDWLGSPNCCWTYDNGTFCPSTLSRTKCTQCKQNWHNETVYGNYIDFFLEDIPNSLCTKG